MATIKTCSFPTDGKGKVTGLEVKHDNGTNPDGSPALRAWSLTPEQAAKHDAMFRPDMSAAERAKLDALK